MTAPLLPKEQFIEESANAWLHLFWLRALLEGSCVHLEEEKIAWEIFYTEEKINVLLDIISPYVEFDWEQFAVPERPAPVGVILYPNFSDLIKFDKEAARHLEAATSYMMGARLILAAAWTKAAASHFANIKQYDFRHL